MSEKAKRIICIYALAAIAVLGLCAGVGNARLRDFRLAARYSASRAFDETVGAVDSLSRSLRKSVYSTDGAMCCRICSDICADARAAQTALSTLPFSTLELSEISGFLGVTGDYAYTLCSEAAAEGFSEEQLNALSELSSVAEEFAALLRELRGSIDDGTITMDTREVRLRNVGEDTQTVKLSQRLNEYAASFTAPAALQYDGRYTARDGGEATAVSAEELAETAADFLGVGTASLDLKYEYGGTDPRRCYACRGMEVCVDANGVVCMGCDRLVSEAKLSLAEAQKKAENFLSAHGYDGLSLYARRQEGGTAVFEYVQLAGDAVCLDHTLRLSVALDDGSIHSFHAESYDPALQIDWPEEPLRSVREPHGLTLNDLRPVVIESAGGRDVPCWELSCTDADGRTVTIYADAQSGEQRKIVL